MRRTLATLLVVLGAAGAAVYLTGIGREDDEEKRYYVQLDNAFGLIEGADLKIAGVRAGKITTMELDQRTMYAKIGIRVDEEGFDDLRKDVFCESRPQSLIGEYFLDCQPGKSSEKLPVGATIPVKQTGTTIPPDLVNNIMRRPYRERFSIIMSELGATLAARGGDLNETIRRANPALRETDRVLRILAEERTVIRDLYRDADRVVARLADSRGDVGRFVEEARDTASISASRADGVRRQWRTFPTFLRELRPTMTRLGEAVDAQRPALRELNANAERLRVFFATLGPFAEASRPALRSLASAARAGRPAIRAARPNIQLLATAVEGLPEVAQNLAITLEHLDDPKFATEKDARAGRGKDGGYTGLEALMRYFFAQSQAINLFDGSSFTLKATPFIDRPCANYADAETVKNQTEAEKRCRAWLGPNQPGITSPDFTKTGAGAATRSRSREAAPERGPSSDRDRTSGGSESGSPADRRQSAPGGRRGAPRLPAVPMPPDVKKLLDEVLPGGAPLPDTPKAPATPPAPKLQHDRGLLDFLLAP
jgi:ABC-type transporter Mla subunit MlaD